MACFKNPVLPGQYPDPSVCRVGQDFYLVTSSFAYFPGVPIFHSRDLVSWRQIGHCLDRSSQIDLRGAPSWGGIWAPTIRHHQGTFYMTTTIVGSSDYFDCPKGNFIVTASRPEGPWSDPVFVDQEGIDPSLFFDEDGSVYCTTSREGALQSRIDVATGEMLTEARVVWEGSGGKYPEGPHLYRIGDTYYLLISEGGTEYTHMVTVARSNSPWGPFEPCARNPVLTHRSYMSPIQGVGHADLVDTPAGDWFAVALGFRPHGYPPCYHLGRETFLCPVRFVDDGFPQFGTDGRLQLEDETSLDLDDLVDVPARDDFDDAELDAHFNFLRNPVSRAISLGERPGFLRLRGTAAGLDDAAPMAWVGRRQQHFDVTATASLEFSPMTDRDEAGLVAGMNETHHYEIFMTLRGNVPTVVVRRRIGKLVAEIGSRALPIETTSVVLSIAASAGEYVFSCGASENALEPLADGEVRYLSTEVAGGFTGVYLAMYATGNGRPCGAPADFDWFEYVGKEQ